MSVQHGGNLHALARSAGLPAERILDLSANINPLGPPPCLRAVISRRLEDVVHYPDVEATELIAAIAAHYDVPLDGVLVGNGSTEILRCLPHALSPTRAVIPVPSYVDYAETCRLAGLSVLTVPLREERGFAVDFVELERIVRAGDMVFLGQPNNPTGTMFSPNELRILAQRRADATFVIDEAFADFAPGYRSLSHNVPPNAVVLLSLTKFYAIPGLRLGCAAAAPDLARKVRRFVAPWSVNALAQAAGAAVLKDADYARRTREYVALHREELAAGLNEVPGLSVVPGQANFLLVRIDRGDITAAELGRRLLAQGIAIRVCDNFEGLDRRYFRVAVATADDNRRLLESMQSAMGVRPARRRRPRRSRSIMFQGTGSNAGKSVLTAALCRILLQDGVRVAPFKAQNMSLNSFVTADGGEMGRAQVVQAQACRLAPDVRMNPILLKPNSDTGCQVILRGRVVGNMNVHQYARYKEERAEQAVHDCYDSLADEYDVIVLEGAGSPGEVNLKRQDIVNMRMARHARSPVLLVGDIDRGGVFASFVGTMEVLEEWERSLVAGFVVNRFRGDASLLSDALDYTLAHTGKPVLGVVPYLDRLDIPQEDSVEYKSGRLIGGQLPSRGRAAVVDVAVIDLPHISNFTDLDALRIERDVRLRVVRGPKELAAPDAVILPGSKNVMGDMAWLAGTGLVRKLVSLARRKTEIVGICGGFQILGRRILDPNGLESVSGQPIDGLGLLETQTVLAREKTLTRTAGRHGPSGKEVVGYEIHHGQTSGKGLEAVVTDGAGQPAGWARRDGRVWGTYLHGLFDADGFRRWWINRLRTRRGLSPLRGRGASYDIEPALDRLAAAVRESLKMDEIYRLIGL